MKMINGCYVVFLFYVEDNCCLLFNLFDKLFYCLVGNSFSKDFFQIAKDYVSLRLKNKFINHV